MREARKDFLPWDDYLISIALMLAQRSKDPSTRVGACLVDSKNRIVGWGFNGFPRGVDDLAFPYDSDGPYLETKNPYVVHAELNSILNSVGELQGAKLYSTFYPCNECAKSLIQKGITEVIYMSDRNHDKDPWAASRRLFDNAGVKTRKHVPSKSTLESAFKLILEEIVEQTK